MFDGFDEITLTRPAVLGLLRQLATLDGVERYLFVASRDLTDVCEKSRKTNLDIWQENYLCNYWKKLKIFQNNNSEGLIRSFALKTVDKMSVIEKRRG